MGVQGGVATRGISRGLRHPPAQGFALRSNEHVRLRLPCPCRRSPPVLPVGSLRKARLLSFLTRGARGGTTMKDVNRVQLIGHVGQDPEVTYTERGVARTTCSVATSQRWKDADGQAQEATEWTRCVAWGTLAEVCAQYLRKGSRIYVAGRLHTLRWNDAVTGERHARVEIVLDDLILLDHRSGARVAASDDAEPLPC